MSELYSLVPEGPWLYQHQDPLFRCVDCNREIRVSELVSEEDDDGHVYSDQICPKCNSWDVLGNGQQIEYERLSYAQLQSIWDANRGLE